MRVKKNCSFYKLLNTCYSTGTETRVVFLVYSIDEGRGPAKIVILIAPTEETL